MKKEIGDWLGRLGLAMIFLLMLIPAVAAQGELFLFGGIWLTCVALSFIITIIIMVWVYRDAEKRGKSGVLWLIIVFFLGIIGLIIWLVVRPPLQAMPPPGYPPQGGYPPPPGGGYPPPPGYPPQGGYPPPPPGR